MSRSSSAGDLVPKDITEILALQANKKKRGSSLGRAFSWFKGSKRKRSLSNGQSRTGGPCGRSGENTTTKQTHASDEPCKAGQKPEDQKLSVHYTTSQHYQENVFIEGCRPKYLEDLHTEAQEGLKILQQEEHRNGVDSQDDQSVTEDASSRDRDESLETESTAGYSIISSSSISAVSSRPVLTRQGSTFKPLNPVKRLDKTKRRSRRTTIMGIPQQVQKELDMARGTTLQKLQNGEHYSEDDSSGTVVIPTIDGEPPSGHHEGARVHLQNIEVLQTSRDEELLIQHIQSVYPDESQKLEPGMFLMQRPKSLAVPGMTTSCLLQEPQGPVMSISPQATYLSKIIPNAVLPAAIDIIEINHAGVSTISNSSSTASPASSRSEDKTSKGLSTSSPNRSHSQSSETVVSNSSTISSKEKALTMCIADSTKEALDLNPKDIHVAGSNINICSDGKCTNQRLEHKESSNAENVRNSSLFSRNLSVMKTKLPPAPPQRTYSLHHEKLKHRSKEWVDIKDFKDRALNNAQRGQDLSSAKDSANKEKSSFHSLVPNSSRRFESSLKSSPVSPDQAFTECQTGSSSSSPQKTASSESKFDRTLSPSSGYSSQSATPTHSPKEVSPSSPGNRRGKHLNPERGGVRTSLVVSVSSSMTSLSSAMSDIAHKDTQTNTTPSEALKLFPPVTTVQNKVTPPHPTITIRELCNIPPPPKVKAPSPPPPETWIHNKRTFELLCGPGPNICMLQQLQIQKKETLVGKTQNTDILHNTEQLIREVQTSEETRAGSQMENKEEQNEAVPPNVHEQMMAEPQTMRHECSTLPTSNEQNEQEGTEIHEVQTQDQRRQEDLKEQGHQLANKKLPKIKVDQTNCEANMAELMNITSTRKSYKANAEDQIDCTVKDIPNPKSMHNLGIDIPEVNGISPPPSPPPAHHPPPPPTKQPLASSVSILAPDDEKHRKDTEAEVTSLESSWPPPPPPMDESADLMFVDELEFPPPPPSIIHEPSNNCHEESLQRQAEIELESTEVIDMVSSPEQKSDIHIISLKRMVENCTVMGDRQHDKSKSGMDVLQFSVDKDQVENTAIDSPKVSGFSHNELLQVEAILHPKPSAQFLPDIRKESTNVPLAPPLPVEDQSTVNFKRQVSPANKDNWSKELLGRHKNTPIPKEDANIPLVTPSLLQMVRLRSVNVEDQVNDDGKTCPETTANKNHQISSQVTPQKPIRKSLTLKSNPPTSSVTVTAPSMCLQEAIRMKTAALSSGGASSMLNLRLSSTGATNSPCDLHKSPASTASFIFSKSTKKVVIETPTSPDAQQGLRQNLLAEITQVSDQANMVIANGTKKSIKVPPPVAKKPVHGINLHNKLENATTDKTECLTKKQMARVNGQSDTVHPAGQGAHELGNHDNARSTETTC